MKNLSREWGAEFLGTFLLVALGCGSVAQFKLGGEAFGSFLSINLSWGIAVALGVCVAGQISGAHLNPAVTLALAVHRGFPWRKVASYVSAQMAGAFLGAASVFVIYREAFEAFDAGTRAVVGSTATAGIFATYPATHLSLWGGLVDQTIATALLMIALFAFGDPRNEKWARLTPLLVGVLVVVIGMSFGFNAGYAINPARDLGPRLFTLMAGWGTAVFTADGGWWWVPLVGPCLGAVLAGFVYDFFLASAPSPATSVDRPAL